MRRASTLALLFADYFAAAKVGLSFASIHPSATAIWPATGIAIAAFLLLGVGVWPAICAAAFLANFTAAGSVMTSIGIAGGSVLEGLFGAFLVERFARGRHVFDRPPDIFRFVLRSEEHTSELQSPCNLVCRLLLEKKNRSVN